MALDAAGVKHTNGRAFGGTDINNGTSEKLLHIIIIIIFSHE